MLRMGPLMLQCFVVSTLVSMTPATPFLFRNYELPASAEAHAREVCCVNSLDGRGIHCPSRFCKPLLVAHHPGREQLHDVPLLTMFGH